MEGNLVNFQEAKGVPLPPTVEAAISRIRCKHDQPPLSESTRQKLASIGEAESLRMLKISENKEVLYSFENYLKALIQNGTNSPQKRPSSSQGICSSTSLSSPGKTIRLMNSSSSPGANNGDFQTPTTTQVQTYPLMSCSQGAESGVIQTPAFPTPPLSASSANVAIEGGSGSHLEALGELQFRKQFLILNYIGLEKLEEAFKTADEIRKLKDLAMDDFEDKVCDAAGGSMKLADRCKSSQWESGMTHNYYCHVSDNRSFNFKGPYLDKARNHLQKVLGDDNILNVKFDNVKDDKSSARNHRYAVYRKIAKEGIVVGLRRYRFFVFKDGGKEARKKDPTASVRCYFVRFESNASIDDGEEYILSGKTVQDARCVFMHIHTVSNMAKYMARFSLILSKTMKLEVDMTDQVNVEKIEDILCLDEDGCSVYDKDGKPRIHSDGTGYISEDLALKCPANVFKGSILKGYNVEGKLSDIEQTESHHRVPPLLVQVRLFHKGRAVKGTLLVNKKLPHGTIQIRPSMIKVEQDPERSNICTRDSLEVVTTSNQPRNTTLSRNLVLLLSYGGVPDDYFMEILKNALEESQTFFTKKRAALKVSLNYGGLDDLAAAKMILSGIPLEESFLKYRMSVLLNEERKSLRVGRLPIPDSFYLMGTVDPTGLLKRDEVSIILDNGQLRGKVLVYHQPGIHFGDIHVLNAKYVEALHEYVGHAKYAIFFPSKGPRSLADEMAGADFDGDLFFVSRNPQLLIVVYLKLLEYYKVSEPWIEMPSTSGVSNEGPSEVSKENLEDELFEQFLSTRFQPRRWQLAQGSHIGGVAECGGVNIIEAVAFAFDLKVLLAAFSFALSASSDCWTAIMDRFLTLKDDNTHEKDQVKKNLLRLVDLYYEALDAPKNGKKIEVPGDLRVSLFPHYMEKKNSFKSTSILGKIYDFVKSYAELQSNHIEVQKLPFFVGGFSEELAAIWGRHYDQYRQEMVSALSCNTKEEKEEAATALFNKYKKILYGATEIEQRERPLDQIHQEARAIYNVCYDYARQVNDVKKCGFAWKVAGAALLNMYVSNHNEMLLPTVPSVLKELFS
ncbi:RNA-dependent RNA polymerase, eukaryotic-type [Corchorus capsularis]|uniref:RNA-dependent RNA polymerase n=1 Tax=Corchorus capsularis TaxID=210143 RepID=A0A1R3IJ96_COCAP|nr:RNA-dependent RNA polymerase, eukaryotic-type [Corchorus capsularis]